MATRYIMNGRYTAEEALNDIENAMFDESNAFNRRIKFLSDTRKDAENESMKYSPFKKCAIYDDKDKYYELRSLVNKYRTKQDIEQGDYNIKYPLTFKRDNRLAKKKWMRKHGDKGLRPEERYKEGRYLEMQRRKIAEV